MSDLPERRTVVNGENLMALTTWEVYYEYQVVGRLEWYYSKSSELPTEAVAREMFENFFDKPNFRNVEVVEVVRNVILQRKEHGAATTIVKTKGNSDATSN